jgi:hypothetical protein
MDRKEWALLAIAAGGDAGLTPVQLQKSLFLYGKHRPDEVGEDYYRFAPYDYGPFDAEVYRDAQRLQGAGLVDITSVPGRRWNKYVVSSMGLELAASLKKRRAVVDIEHLEALVKWARGLTFSELVRAIYQLYPEYRANSVFQG